MISLSSTDAVVDAISHARSISLSAYLLPSGPVKAALLTAARRGADVTVRLEGEPYTKGVTRVNEATVAALHDAGINAQTVAGVHIKALVADGVAYLDDVNWTRRDETILRDDAPDEVAMVKDAILGNGTGCSASFATQKRDATGIETSVLDSAKAGDDVIVETESFGYGDVYGELKKLAARGCHVRLLVAKRDLRRSPTEQKALDRMRAAGVEVRSCNRDEKFAVVGDVSWVGSANATYSDFPERDWGVRTQTPGIAAHLRSVFDSRWPRARM